MAYDNKNRGSVWKNNRKEEPHHADFTGTYTDAAGIEYWVKAWKRKEGAAEKAPALTFTLDPKEKKADRVPGNASTAIDIDDEIPF